MRTKRRKVEGQNRLEENAKRKIWTMNKELKPRKLAIKVFQNFLLYLQILFLSAEKPDEKSP